jgi:hypothetical protein
MCCKGIQAEKLLKNNMHDHQSLRLDGSSAATPWPWWVPDREYIQGILILFLIILRY